MLGGLDRLQKEIDALTYNSRSVMNAIDKKYDSMTDFELVDELSKIANVKVPNAIEEIRTAPVLHDKQCDIDKMQTVVREFLGI